MFRSAPIQIIFYACFKVFIEKRHHFRALFMRAVGCRGAKCVMNKNLCQRAADVSGDGRRPNSRDAGKGTGSSHRLRPHFAAAFPPSPALLPDGRRKIKLHRRAADINIGRRTLRWTIMAEIAFHQIERIRTSARRSHPIHYSRSCRRRPSPHRFRRLLLFIPRSEYVHPLAAFIPFHLAGRR